MRDTGVHHSRAPGSQPRPPGHTDPSSPTLHEQARIAIAHGTAVVASGLAAWIREQTNWDVVVLDTRPAVPWHELVGKHVIVTDALVLAHALRSGTSSSSFRPAWTRLVLVSDVQQSGFVRLTSPEVDAVVGPDCTAEALVDAIGPQLTALSRGDVVDSDLADRPFGQSLGSAPPPAHAGPAKASTARFKGGLLPHALRRVREYVAEHLSDRLEVEALAAIARLSDGHFGRAFKQSTGMPPHRYVLLSRIRLAAELVRDTQRTFADIGATVGFSDQSHFTRVFTKVTGDAPGAFRRLHR